MVKTGIMRFSTLICFLGASVLRSSGLDESTTAYPHWYPEKTTNVFDDFLRRKLEPYEHSGLTDGWVQRSLELGACAECDPSEKRWNTHFKIVNGTAYSVGGIPSFWNDHHRKRVKSVFALLSKLLKLDPKLPDVEFVVNFHDYNKLLRERSLKWGEENYTSPFLDVDNMAGAGIEGDRDLFKEHLEEWPGQDWGLYYRIYGNHFGNTPQSVRKGLLMQKPAQQVNAHADLG